MYRIHCAFVRFVGGDGWRDMMADMINVIRRDVSDVDKILCFKEIYF